MAGRGGVVGSRRGEGDAVMASAFLGGGGTLHFGPPAPLLYPYAKISLTSLLGSLGGGVRTCSPESDAGDVDQERPLRSPSWSTSRGCCVMGWSTSQPTSSADTYRYLRKTQGVAATSPGTRAGGRSARTPGSKRSPGRPIDDSRGEIPGTYPREVPMQPRFMREPDPVSRRAHRRAPRPGGAPAPATRLQWGSLGVRR